MNQKDVWAGIDHILKAFGVDEVPVFGEVFKSAESTDDDWIFEGVATADATDLVNEAIDVGFINKSLQYFLQHGKFTWDHSDLQHPDPTKRRVQPGDMVGVPTEARVRKSADGGLELYVKGRLNKAVKKAQQIWSWLNGGEKLGMSIEGIRLAAKSAVDNTRQPVLKIMPLLTHIALTPKPVLPGTWAVACKALSNGAVEVIGASIVAELQTPQPEGEKAMEKPLGIGPAPGEPADVQDPAFVPHMTLGQAIGAMMEAITKALPLPRQVLQRHVGEEIAEEPVAAMYAGISQADEELALLKSMVDYPKEAGGSATAETEEEEEEEEKDPESEEEDPEDETEEEEPEGGGETEQMEGTAGLVAKAVGEVMEPVTKALEGILDRLESLESAPADREGLLDGKGGPDNSVVDFSTSTGAGQPVVKSFTGTPVTHDQVMQACANKELEPDVVAHLVMRRGGLRGGDDAIEGLEVVAG